MTMAEVIREKRREQELTQEQVANALGVTAPAVNKWEKGSTCPDVALLPPLARLLKTDLNTLFCYQEQLTPAEIVAVMNQVSDTFREKGLDAAFSQAEEKLREYPNCDELWASMAQLMDGILLLAAAPAEERQPFADRVLQWYERAAESASEQVRNRAAYMLAAKYTQAGAYDRAQEMLDRLPERSAADKQIIQADLLVARGQQDAAAELMERRLWVTVLELMNLMMKLITLEIKAGDRAAASEIADKASQAAKVLDLWDYYGYLARLQVPLAEEDTEQAVSLIRALLACVMAPSDMSLSPLYHRAFKAPPRETWEAVLPPLLKEMEAGPQYAFLQENTEFQSLMTEYRAKVPEPEHR